MRAEKYILVVDDEFDVRTALRDVLTDEGYEVLCAGDGVEALELLESRPAAMVIILDWMMPRMDGKTFALELRKRPEHAATPVLLVTGDLRAPQKASEIGATSFLSKPIRLNELLMVIDGFAA